MQSVPGSVIQKGRPKYEYFSGNFRLYSPLTLQIFLSLQSTHQPALQQQYTCLPFFGAWPSRPPSSLSGCCLYHKKWPSMLPSIQYNYWLHHAEMALLYNCTTTTLIWASLKRKFAFAEWNRNDEELSFFFLFLLSRKTAESEKMSRPPRKMSRFLILHIREQLGKK